MAGKKRLSGSYFKCYVKLEKRRTNRVRVTREWRERADPLAVDIEDAQGAILADSPQCRATVARARRQCKRLAGMGGYCVQHQEAMWAAISELAAHMQGAAGGTDARI